MTSTKSKALYWLFKVLSVAVSCTFPIWAICERFPLWEQTYGSNTSIGAGGLMIFAVLIIVFRRTIFEFLRERLRLRHAPPLLVWLVMLLLAYTLMYISRFTADMIDVFWMGFIGCAIGTALTFVAENVIRKKDTDDRT